MTLRRYAPLALAALALGCEPKIDERANPTTVDYALFNPAASQIPTPNDAALSKVSAFVSGAYAAAPCNMTGTAQGTALCAFARAGGFPAADAAPIAYKAAANVGFVRGTLAADGSVSYGVAPQPEALKPSTLAFALLSAAPTLGVVDLTTGTPVTNATATFDPATGALTVTPSGGAWSAGHRYAIQVQGGAKGPTTLTGGEYTAMPAFFILREAVIANLDLSKPENQGLFPGDAATKMASGTALEALRAGYHFLYATGGYGAAATTMKLPFADAISFQTFQIAPGTGSVTVGNGTEPATAPSVTGGSPGLVDSFTVQSSLGSATIVAVVFGLTAGDAAVNTLFVNSSATCNGTTYGTSAAVTGLGAVTIALTTYPPAPLTAASPLYVCANTKTVAGPTAISGTVAGLAFFPGTTYSTVANDSADAGLTVN